LWTFVNMQKQSLKPPLNFENCMKKLFFFQKKTQKVVNQFTFRCPNFFDQMYLVPGNDPEHRYNLLVKLVKKISCHKSEFIDLSKITM